MDRDIRDHLKKLHTSAIDARNGYHEALEDAEGKGLTPLFREMVTLHDQNAGELGDELVKVGETPDSEGSFMSTVHQTIMDIRSLFGGLDESVLSGLIDGEKRNLGKYDDALKTATAAPVATLLRTQRSRIEQRIAQMQAENARFEKSS